MRCDRSVSVATILVLLCCVSGVAAVGSISTTQVLVASVVASTQVSSTDGKSFELLDTAPSVLYCNIETSTPSRIEKNVLHNLPPPFGV